MTVLAVQIGDQQQRLGLSGFEAGVDEPAQASGQQPGEALDVSTTQAAQMPAEPEHLADLTQAGRPGIQRQLEEQRLQPGGQPAQLGMHRAERPRIGRGVPLEPDRDAVRVVPVGQHLAAVQRDLQGRLAWDHPQPMVAEPQAPDDLGPQHARDVGSGGRPAARGDLLGDAAAADHVPCLDHQRGQAGPGQHSKAGLSLAAYQAAGRPFSGYLDAPPDVREQGFFAVLRYWIMATPHLIHEDWIPYRVTLIGNYCTSLALRREITQFLLREDPYGTQAFVRFGIDRGEIRRDIDPRMIVSMVDWLMDRGQDAMVTEELDPACSARTPSRRRSGTCG
jgi:hypothetical protein